MQLSSEVYVVAEKTTYEQINTTTERQQIGLYDVFSTLQAEQATYQNENASHVATSIIPELPQGEANYSWWWDTYYSSLVLLLNMARVKEECQKITQSDLQRIEQCCHYDGYLPATVSKRKVIIQLFNYFLYFLNLFVRYQFLT